MMMEVKSFRDDSSSVGSADVLPCDDGRLEWVAVLVDDLAEVDATMSMCSLMYSAIILAGMSEGAKACKCSVVTILCHGGTQERRLDRILLVSNGVT